MTGVTGSGVGVTGGTETTRRTEVRRLLRLLRYEKNKCSGRRQTNQQTDGVTGKLHFQKDENRKLYSEIMMALAGILY